MNEQTNKCFRRWKGSSVFEQSHSVVIFFEANIDVPLCSKKLSDKKKEILTERCDELKPIKLCYNALL